MSCSVKQAQPSPYDALQALEANACVGDISNRTYVVKEKDFATVIDSENKLALQVYADGHTTFCSIAPSEAGYACATEGSSVTDNNGNGKLDDGDTKNNWDKYVAFRNNIRLLVDNSKDICIRDRRKG